MLSGRRTPLDAFAVAVAVTVSLMFVCVLLASGLLALEREENTFTRLARGLVAGRPAADREDRARGGVLVRVTLAMLLGVSLFVPLDLGRFGLWLHRAVAAARSPSRRWASRSAASRARCGRRRCWRSGSRCRSRSSRSCRAAASRRCSTTSSRSSRAVFPFKASLEAIDAAVNGSSPGLGQALAHLAALVVVFGAAARAGLRRFA